MLDIEKLTAGYDGASVLHGVSLTVKPGEVVALLGRNGAGKSTLLKSIMGLITPTGGTVRFQGQAITGMAPQNAARLGLGYVPEERRIFTDLSVAENLEVGRRPIREGAPHWTVEALTQLFPNLAEVMDRPGGRISGGEQQMLTLARTLMGNPRCLLLDEPSEGISPLLVQSLAKALATVKKTGLSILLSEQNLRFCATLADRAYLLESGEIKAQLPMAELMEHSSLRQRYLSV
ncbi:ABC transporter ATP-binding protein [Lacibacterium aquatile]|uniref:ABC transporter ATP-binding protein n=1 Tax=Lacibacterium aquatile TaxID=1168082 RepID=A0ABW5DSY2_9PROT